MKRAWVLPSSFKLILLFFRKLHRNSGAAVHNTLQINFGIVQPCRVFYNGKSQSRAADFFGMAFVYPIEPLKNPFLVLLRDTDSRIGNRENDKLFFIFDCLTSLLCQTE